METTSVSSKFFRAGAAVFYILTIGVGAVLGFAAVSRIFFDHSLIFKEEELWIGSVGICLLFAVAIYGTVGAVLWLRQKPHQLPPSIELLLVVITLFLAVFAISNWSVGRKRFARTEINEDLQKFDNSSVPKQHQH